MGEHTDNAQILRALIDREGTIAKGLKLAQRCYHGRDFAAAMARYIKKRRGR